MNSWTRNFFHDQTGKILGEVYLFAGDKYKATYDNQFVGWYINELCAKTAVETKHAVLITSKYQIKED